MVDGWIADEKMWKNGPTYREYYPIPTNAISIEEMKEWINEAFNKDDSEIRSDFEFNARTTFLLPLMMELELFVIEFLTNIVVLQFMLSLVRNRIMTRWLLKRLQKKNM